MSVLTVVGLAASKRLPPDFLQSLRLRDDARGVAIPYHDEASKLLFERTRLSLNGGRRFHQPAGVSLIPYGLDRLEAAREAGYIAIVEGESDCWVCWHADFPALGLPGAGAANSLQAEHLAGIPSVFVSRESGAGGAHFVQSVAKRLKDIGYSGEAFEFSCDPYKDPSDLYCDDPEGFRERFKAALNHITVLPIEDAQLPAGKETGEAIRIRACDITCESVLWLWPGRIALGKLSLLVGDPGEGKSFAALDIAARVSTARPWPDGGSVAAAGDVIILSAEDGLADTIVPRLAACGADLARVHILTAVRAKGGERHFSLQTDLAALEAAVEQTNAVLVVIDPITAYLGGGDSHKNADMRQVLAPLAALAANHHLAILGISHLNKAEAHAIYRVTGSLAFVAAARAVYVIAPDRENPARKIFARLKNNLAPPSQTALAFTIEGEPPAVKWESASFDVNVAELLAPDLPAPRRRGRKPDKREAAEALLRDLLKDRKEHASDPIIETAKKRGIAYRTLARAASELDVVKRKTSVAGGWTWQLPAPGVLATSPQAPVSPDNPATLANPLGEKDSSEVANLAPSATNAKLPDSGRDGGTRQERFEV